jgi:alpha-1,6-mannosyltransferase
MLTEASIPAMAGTRRDLAALGALGALGVLAVVFLAAAPWIVSSYDYAVFIPCLLVSGAITIAATALSASVPTRTGLMLILVLAAVMRLVVVLEEPLLSTDIYRYIWDGRVQAAGINPYLYVPADPALASLRDAAIYPNINRAEYAVTAYPPVAEMFFFLVTRISESLTAMRLAMVACDAAVILLLVRLLQTLRLPLTAVVAWAWHPLVVWEVGNSGHVEALMVALLMAGVTLLVRQRALTGAVMVAFAALAKPYAIVALPAFWRRWDWRLPLVVAATVALCYLPYAAAGRGALGFLTASGYFAEEGFIAGDAFWLVGLAQNIFGVVPILTVAYLVAGMAGLAWLALRVSARAERSPQAMLEEIAVLLMAGLFFLSPNYAWYFLAVVPFLALCARSPIAVPAWALTLGSILLYRPIFLPDNDLAWKTLAALPFVVAVAWTLLRRRTPEKTYGASEWTS